MRSAFMAVVLGSLAWACFDTSPANAQILYRRWYYNNYGYFPRQANWYSGSTYPASTYTAPTTTYYSPMPAQPVVPASAMQPAPSAPSTAATTVTIADGSFQPNMLRVSTGTSVRWENRGQRNHTVTATDGSWDSGNLAPGGSFSRTFSQAGTFTYRCNLHPQMQATIIVEQGTATAPRSPY